MRAWLANVLRLGIKELRSLRADPVLVALIIYTFTFAIYSVATGAKFEVDNAAVAVVDDDRSDLSRRIAAAFLPPYFRTPERLDAVEAQKAMDEGRVVFVVTFPPNFEADMRAGRNPTLQVIVDATAMSLAGNGAAYIQNIISQEVLGFASRAEYQSTLPINLLVRANFNPNLSSVWFAAVMQIINNVTMLAVILTGAALIREREHGTIEHLLVMPVTPSEIMTAKIWANGLVILVAATLSLLLVVQGLLDVPIAGSVGVFVLGALLYQFSVTALGITLATFTTSMAQFGLLVLPVLIMMNLLSGSATPMESMPVWLQNGMQISPSTHFVAFSQAVLYRGAGLDIVWPDMLAMLAIGAILFVIALRRFRETMAAAR